MYVAALTTVLSQLLLLSSTGLTSAIPTRIEARHALDTAEVYYLTNCFQNVTDASFAEIDYYADSSMSTDGETPDIRAHINRDTSVDWEDATWVVTKPFHFTVYIDVDAYTAPAGTLVGNAKSSTFAETMNCFRLDRLVLFTPKNWTCYADYACVDSQEM